MNLTDTEYQQICLYLETKCGIVLGDNKQYLVRSRLTPLLARFGFNSISELIIAVIKGNHRELNISVIDAMTTNETLWFRDHYPFDILAYRIFPELAREKKQIKIWSAASSSGQEPYSIAMLVREYQSKKINKFEHVSIVATDISKTMLENCRQGIYDNLVLQRGLSEKRQALFFDDLGNGCMKIKKQIKNMVFFKELNLLESYAALGHFDVIFCRNVLMYFSAEMKNKVLEQMAEALNPGGYLMLGASESLTGCVDKFEMIFCDPGIIYKVIK